MHKLAVLASDEGRDVGGSLLLRDRLQRQIAMGAAGWSLGVQIQLDLQLQDELLELIYDVITAE